MTKHPFIHLHVHSHYSLLDGCIHEKDLVRKAVSVDMPALALTDHGSLFGAVEFYREAVAHGLKPIVGMEAYMARGSHRDRESVMGRAKNNHLTLLAKNETGYKNLIRLSSMGFIDGFYRKPRIDNTLLENHADGLIALSGCMGGAIPQLFRMGETEGAEKLARHYRELFGKEGFYLEIMRNGVQGQEEVNQALIALSLKTSIPLVATNDVHFLEQDDAIVHDAVLCINTGQTLKDERRMKLESDQFYFRSPEEMGALFQDHPEAVENTGRIASLCNLEIEFGKYHLPGFHVENGEDPKDYLGGLCDNGARRLLGEITPEIRARLDSELEVISSMGFPSYFLIVWDFIRFAKEQGIPVGPGRGSAAGSLVAYCLGITEVNPLKYDLIFERFLNSSRISMPDIDIDFCRDGREKVIQYVQDKYGTENVCQIVTFGTMAARAAVRDAGRVLDIPLPVVDGIAKKIPMIPKTKLIDALEGDPELKEIYDTNEELRELFNISMKIEGLNRHASTHAAGVVITDKPLMEYVPLCRVQNEINTQYQMEALEKIGLLKMDFLGLKNLTIMDKAVQLIRKTVGHEVDLSKIPFDDPKTFHLLQSGKTLGIFQLESEGMSNLLVRLRPDTFEDIIALLALYRPGPLKSGMVESYVRRKHGMEEVDYLHESLEDVLKETYGVIVYQEQVMRIANILAGFSLNDADSLRKAMGKKKTEVMAKFRDMFINGAENNGVGREKAGDIYDKIEFFAGYGFNKSHSTAYGFITYQTAYLKANYPLQFMAALMSCDAANSDKLAEYFDECNRMNIKLLGPDFQKSEHDFTPGDQTIRFGLNAIKGLGEKAIETIVNERERRGGFDSIFDMLSSVDLKSVNRSALEALIKAGAFDSTQTSRATYFAALDSLLKWAAGAQADLRSGQGGLFGNGGSDSTWMNLPEMKEWEENLKLAYEKEAIGFFLSSDPLKKYAPLMPFLAPHKISELNGLEDGTTITLGGMVSDLKVRVSKSGRNAGKKLALFRIRTLGGNVSSVIFVKEYEIFKELLEEDNFCLFTGTVDKSREGSTPTLRVTKVDTIDEALKTKEMLILRAGPPEKMRESYIEDVRSVVEKYPGESDLVFYFEALDRKRFTVKAGSRFKVTPNEELIARL
ncbi:MAG: DNA polymerase III subunit alpha, partial [Planctomycetes bacterium]|nr:DNA polymerase III subunit alpha [Planctomycetota bacterium]